MSWNEWSLLVRGLFIQCKECEMWSEGIWEGLVLFFFIAIGLAVGFGMFLMWGLPKLWELIKPWIHSVTA